MVTEHPAGPDVRPQTRWDAPNLLLLLPLAILFTPFYNRVEPRFTGLPFFYWLLLAVLLLTIAFTTLFFVLTRTGDEDLRRTWR